MNSFQVLEKKNYYEKGVMPCALDFIKWDSKYAQLKFVWQVKTSWGTNLIPQNSVGAAKQYTLQFMLYTLLFITITELLKSHKIILLLHDCFATT